MIDGTLAVTLIVAFIAADFLRIVISKTVNYLAYKLTYKKANTELEGFLNRLQEIQKERPKETTEA